MPPRWLRRLLVAPLVLLVTPVVLVSLPLAIVLAVVASPWVSGRWRPLRALCLAIVYLLLETFALAVLFLLWVASGFGLWMRRPWFIEAHYRLVGWVLKVLVGAARRVFNLRIEPEIVTLERSDRSPLLVLCRHAGPGDSFLVVHSLLVNEGRRPWIVLKQSFQWDPMIDVALNRLPTQFITPGQDHSQQMIEAIGELAARLGEGDSLVIFPEGGNYTDQRRLRAIAKLAERDETELAERARAMRNVVAPRPGGTIAAIDNAPDDAVVSVVAHTGLEGLSSAAGLWRGLPMDSAVRSKSWDIPIGEIPAGFDRQVDWLFTRFELIDGWIEANRWNARPEGGSQRL